MMGLFVQRQAEALVPYCDVAVVYVHPDPRCPNKMEAEFSEESGVRVLRIYLKIREGNPGVVNKVRNIWRYYRAYMKALRSIRAMQPDLIHAHVLTRAGVVAQRASTEFGIPFVVSEHWSRYFPENFGYTGMLRRQFTQYLIGQAQALIPVSEKLKLALVDCGLSHHRMPVIANVVNGELFHPIPERSSDHSCKVVHISCFDDKSKNITGFLHSLKTVSEEMTGFHCFMVGEGPDLDDMKSLAQYLRISSSVITFTGLLEGEVLAGMLQNADFSVVSSRYETFGTVIIESLYCGTPVLSTRVGIAEQVVTDDNGLLIEPGNDQAMVNGLKHMINHCGNFNRASISRQIRGRFESAEIGRQLWSVYREILDQKV
jgi:glycosyltransferase involved in cell wall biosynthesis